MEAKLIAVLLLLPVSAIVIYAGLLEYRRYKSEGRANYGLAYDEKTGTTYVTGIAEDEEAYDPDDFDPSNYEDLKIKKDAEDAKS